MICALEIDGVLLSLAIRLIIEEGVAATVEDWRFKLR